MATATQTLRRTTAVHHWPGQLAWILGAGLIGFAMSELFTSILEVSRGWWVAAHAPVVALLMYVYCRWANGDILQLLRRHALAGLLVGSAFAALIAFLIVRTQTASPRHEGLAFAWDLLWLGLVYGVADALLLNVLPVYATWQAAKDLGRTGTWRGNLGTLVVAMAASIVVTVLYHAGFAEFQSTHMIEPIKGNAGVTAGYLLSGNPIAAVFGHVALHVSSVIHGITSTYSLPPHY